MKRILMLPLLRIPSGHHHVADAIRDELSLTGQYECFKEELLSRTFGIGERLVSTAYLKWIDVSPEMYSSIYKRVSRPYSKRSPNYPVYEHLFAASLQRIIHASEPDMVVATHALPSYLLDAMKREGRLHIPIVNVYTDFFINGLWGRERIDGHIIPHPHFKESLIKKGVPEQRIHVLGMPIHPSITPIDRRTFTKKRCYHVLVSGGNLGTGKLYDFLTRLTPQGRIHYRILCGKNEKLYERIVRMEKKWIQPISYIDCREEMNGLYEECDAIITKPGGVTIAESLQKRLPIFVYAHLPGQEEYNFEHLKAGNLIQPLFNWRGAETELLKILDDKGQFETIQADISAFLQRLDRVSLTKRISSIIENEV